VRLWSLHPSLLDAKGLVACWREGLLARKVLQELTRGYRSHPQLLRFRACADPVAAVDSYLAAVWEEALARGYRFDRRKFSAASPACRIAVTEGQLTYELELLRAKIRQRQPTWIGRLEGVDCALAHPMMDVVPGPVEPWERLPVTRDPRSPRPPRPPRGAGAG
jgi:hypothetical protein